MKDLPTTPAPEVDPRITRAAEVLRGCPAEPYSTGVSPAERAFWCERAVSALRGVLDILAERDGDPE